MNRRHQILSTEYRPVFRRLAVIHRLIQGGGRVNAASIAVELEVSQKTVLRDIELMRDCLDLPIEYDRSARVYRYSEELDHFGFIARMISADVCPNCGERRKKK